MITRYSYIIKSVVLLILLFSLRITSHGQGKVVINEFMPWTANICGGPTSEFVELLNFGPGPVDIGCYILTDGDYSITIPANTILQPGEFYVISGQDTIAAPCANIDSTISTDLNWNTCNCTSAPIPTTGDGLFTDGGSASEQVVLLAPNLTVVDAVIRTLPVEPSAQITTFNLGGQCVAQTFDLDLMTFNYETIGQSAGRGNSFARGLDGDCAWLKDPQQSGNATNNTPSETSSVTYDLTITSSMECPDNGSIVIYVYANNYSDVFPMSYTLGFDSDHDYVFETADSYTNGTDSSANSIPLSNLVPGTYKITLASAKGCNLYTFNFTILPCLPVLPVKIISSVVKKLPDGYKGSWSMANSENIQKVVIERSSDGNLFFSTMVVSAPSGINGLWNYNYYFKSLTQDMPFFRLRVHTKSGEIFYSSVSSITQYSKAYHLWPNPSIENLNTSVSVSEAGKLDYSIYNQNGRLMIKGQKMVTKGENLISFPVKNLPAGNYHLIFHDSKGLQNPVRLNFVK